MDIIEKASNSSRIESLKLIKSIYERNIESMQQHIDEIDKQLEQEQQKQ